MRSPVLEVRRLSKRFGALAATSEVTLDVRAGEIHALIGPNGAGKSTLVKQIVGEIKPDSGSVYFEGAPINQLRPAQRALLGLARSFQVSSVIPGFTVRENVVLAAQGSRRKTYRFFRPALGDSGLTQTADRQLQRVRLHDRREVPAFALSHGERRRLEIAMALALRPKVFLLDEPMAGMGAESAAFMADVLGRLRGEAPILLIEHDMEAVFSLADRISVLVYGRIIATGSPADIRRNEAARRAYLGDEI